MLIKQNSDGFFTHGFNIPKTSFILDEVISPKTSPTLIALGGKFLKVLEMPGSSENNFRVNNRGFKL
jgi:hypothetical protein